MNPLCDGGVSNDDRSGGDVEVLHTISKPAQSATIDAALDAQIVSMKKQMPIEIDAITKMTAMIRMGLGITYYYEVKIPERAWTPQTHEAAFQRALAGNCSGKNTRMLLDYGYSLRHAFFDEQGKFVSNVLITKNKVSAVKNAAPLTLGNMHENGGAL